VTSNYGHNLNDVSGYTLVGMLAFMVCIGSVDWTLINLAQIVVPPNRNSRPGVSGVDI
jgi:hypothetical protein